MVWPSAFGESTSAHRLLLVALFALYAALLGRLAGALFDAPRPGQPDDAFLQRLATRIVWLTRQKLQSYPGNYSAFVQQRELQELTQSRAYEEQQADIEKQKEFIRRFGAGQRSKEAKGREKRLDRLLKSDQVIQRVEAQKSVRLKLSTDQRAGDRVLSVNGLEIPMVMVCVAKGGSFPACSLFIRLNDRIADVMSR